MRFVAGKRVNALVCTERVRQRTTPPLRSSRCVVVSSQSSPQAARKQECDILAKLEAMQGATALPSGTQGLRGTAAPMAIVYAADRPDVCFLRFDCKVFSNVSIQCCCSAVLTVT